MSVIRLFEEQVARTPDNTALVFEGKQLTYQELNNRANQLAHHLKKLGVEREQMVGLFLERSFEMVIGILGVLKAGGAYVPLDPESPAERIRFMLQDTRVRILLTQSHLFGYLSTIDTWDSIEAKMDVIKLDADWDFIAHNKTTDLGIELSLTDLAYTIYTSGSTGRPKGVMNEHRGIYNRLLWMLGELPISQDDRVLQKTPYSFDVSIWEFFWPLLSGARLVIAKPGGHKDSDYLVDLITEHGITATHFVPSMLQVFLLNERVENCQSLQRVLCSGEALPYHLQESFFSRLNADLFNLYGPTEAAIEVTYWACQREGDLSTVPIGRPIANTQIHLLDPQLAPVPVGELGELHIGGVQVARGYLNLPELTAEKFIPDPFSDQPGARLYKSGDLASYMPDGTILYQGRIDHQVKIRGNRVELGEIEAALAEHPNVRESVVTAFEAAPGDKRLAAYIVPGEEMPQLMVELRDFLLKKLPEYMIPASYNFLDQLPLTPSGKVDRKALPKPRRVRPNLSEDYVAPRNPAETALVRIFERVIGLDSIGVHDHFLELGGDSIQCIQISSKAHQAGLQVSPNQILELQTIAKLAERAGTISNLTAAQALITGGVSLTPAQKKFIERHEPELADRGQSLVLRVKKPLNRTFLEQAVENLVNHHDMLRMRLVRVDRGYHQEIAAPGEAVPLSYVDRSAYPVADQEFALTAALAEMKKSLDLSSGPIVKFAYIDFGSSGESYLMITLHPLVVDNFSWTILLDHFLLAYQQLSDGKQVQLPPKTTSYQQWAQRLIEFAHSPKLEKEVIYWQSNRGTEPVLLPVDHENEQSGQSKRIPASVEFFLSEDKTRSLLTEVPKAYNSLITDVLLATLVQALSEWTANPNILIDIKGHGREAIFENIDLSQTLGCFTAHYPVWLDISGASSPGEILMGIKEQLRAVPNGGIGFGVLRFLVDGADVQRQFTSQPPAQLSFHYLGNSDYSLNQSPYFSIEDPIASITRISQEDLEHLIEISAGISNNRLFVIWTYSRHRYNDQTIEKLADSLMNFLDEMIAHCMSVKKARFTPSDFPDVDLSQQELDTLLAEISDYEDK
jgi:amino acid adenylation domain-containing protein/non-ribosomal peptide synthase protein (TIGR01720 family)